MLFPSVSLSDMVSAPRPCDYVLVLAGATIDIGIPTWETLGQHAGMRESQYACGQCNARELQLCFGDKVQTEGAVGLSLCSPDSCRQSWKLGREPLSHFLSC